MSDLRIEGVSKTFGRLPVLQGVDLEVESGSFCSILGPSGSGKTTLLRVIAGFERADRGTVSIGDLVVEDARRSVPPDRRRIGYVPQEGSLFPHLTVMANVGFGLPRRDRHGRRVTELLEMVGLAGLERRYPNQLSGGQQQRVALARALAVSPALVLLDEPFSSLDADLRRSVRQDVRRVLAEAGTTALLVTHDQDEALSLSEKVAVIEHGRIGQSGSPIEIYSNPGSPALARSLGEANLLAGVVRGEFVDTALGRLSLELPARSGGRGGEATFVQPDAFDHSAATNVPGPANIVVLVRPEQIELHLDGSKDGPRARVVEREYYGHDAVVRVRGEWSSPGAPGAPGSPAAAAKRGVPGDNVLTVRLADATELPRPGELVGLSVRGSVVGWPAVAPAGTDPGRASGLTAAG